MIATLERSPEREADQEQRSQRRPLPIKVTSLSVVASVALTCVTLAIALSFCRIFPGWAFVRSLVVVTLVMHGYGLFSRWRRWTMLPAALVGLAVLGIVVGLLYYRDSLAVFLPTRTTWDLVWRDLSDSMSQFSSAVPPVPASGGFILAAGLGVGFTALFSDVLAFRAYGRAEAIVPSLLLFVVGSSLGYSRNRIAVTLLWLMTVVIALAFLRALHSESSRPWLSTDHRHSPARAIAGAIVPFAMIAVPVGLYAGAHLPGSTSKAILDTHKANSGATDLISPLVSVRSRLTSQSDVEMFTVRTDHPSYLRLTSLSNFDGSGWTSSGDYGSAANLDDGSGVTGTASTSTVVINHLGYRWVPTQYEPRQVVANAGEFKYDKASSTLLYSQANLVQGLKIQVASVLPNYSADQLRQAPPSSGPENKRYLQLPSDFPANFVQLATQITAGATTPYDQAMALQIYFRDNFTYNVNVPEGDSDRTMQAFLNQKQGFCQQFAATFAAFARSIGLPTRVAIGFTPGDVDADGLYHVKGKHAHAWPEVWLDGFGWVYFEPTPGRGAPGADSYTGVQPAQSGGVYTGTSSANAGDPGPAVPVTAAPAGSRSGGDPDAVASTPRSPTPKPATAPAAKPLAQPGAAIGWWMLLALVIVALWAALMPPVMRIIRKRRFHDRPVAYIGSLWSLACVALRAVGFEDRPDETPVQQASRSAEAAGWGQHAITELAQTATKAVYSPTPLSPSEIAHVDDVYHAIATAIRQRASVAVRVRVRLDPRLAIALT